MSTRVKGVVVFLAIAFGGTWSYLLVARLRPHLMWGC
jgi:hypothetical protein